METQEGGNYGRREHRGRTRGAASGAQTTPKLDAKGLTQLWAAIVKAFAPKKTVEAIQTEAVAKSSVLTTQEQIMANTDPSNVAGATAIKEINTGLSKTGTVELLAVFDSTESVVKQTKDWSVYKSFFAVCYGYNQVVFSQCLPITAVLSLGAGVRWRFGEVVTYDKYGGSIYHTGKTTEINARTMRSDYPLYIYVIL